MEQTTIFDLLYDKYVIRKPISLIEFFAGYGSQALALKYLGANYESHKIVEWAVKSIEAYNDLHTKDYTDYSKDLSKEQLVEFLFNKGISMDYSQPMTLKQIKSKSEEWCRKVYNDIIATHNLVDISRVHAVDLEMRGGQENIITYSFPCQDLSLAGKGKGMSKDSGTRSGLLWQVERILLECKDTGIMPNILIMENVPEVKGSNNIEDFTAWIRQLERLGYSNYCEVLNAKNYGIPQNRNRCFMVSILGEYNYSFPKHIKLKYKLKDILEKDVPEKYFLSGKQISEIQKWNAYEKPLENMENSDNFMKGRDRLQEGKEIADTLQTNGKEGIVIKELIPFGSYYTWRDNQGNINTQCNRAVGENGVALTVACAETGKVLTNTLRIRKLTPKECWRLMGVLDKDSELVKQSDSSKYHLAGDSIVSTCLMGIFGELLGIDYKSKIEELVENIRQK